MSAQDMALDCVSLKGTYLFVCKFVTELLGILGTLIGAFEAFRCDRVYARLHIVKEEERSWNNSTVHEDLAAN